MKKRLAEASVPPLGFYTDQEYYQLDVECIFRRNWNVVGRAEQVITIRVSES